MTGNGDAAEQVVRLSLEGVEVAARITGSAAKNVAVLLAAVLRQGLSQTHKTRGRARLTSMLKSGKELQVFAIPRKDLETFVQHAKQYGILYCVLREKDSRADGEVDIIARAEDAPRIQRIVNKFGMGKVDRASFVPEVLEEKEQGAPENPSQARAEAKPLSGPNSGPVGIHTDKGDSRTGRRKPSVRKKLDRIKSENTRQRNVDNAAIRQRHEKKER